MVIVLVAVCAVLGAAIGWQTPLIAKRTCDVDVAVNQILAAIAGAIVLALIGWSIGWNWSLPAFLWMGAAGTVLGFIDIEHHRLPDRLTLPSYPIMAVLLLLPAVIDGAWSNYLRALLGAVALFVFYFLLALIYPAGMGMGDVKLAGSLGMGLGFLGWAAVIIGGFSAFFFGAIIGVGIMVTRKGGRKTAIPFGPFMLLGALFALLFAQDLADWYLHRTFGS